MHNQPPLSDSLASQRLCVIFFRLPACRETARLRPRGYRQNASNLSRP